MSSDGNNYGLNGSYDYNEIEIDSFDATQAFNTAYTSLNWPKIFLGKPLENVVAMKVLDATIPFTFYPFNSTNNTFVLNQTAPAAGPFTVTIPVGSYTTSTFPAILKAAMELANGATKTFTVTYDSATAKLTITINVGTFTITTSGGLVASPCYTMGLNSNTVHSSTGTALITPNAIRILGPEYIYVNSNTIGSVVNVYLNGSGLLNTTGSGADGPQICKIGRSVTFTSTMTYTDPDPQKWFYVGNQNLTALDFYLTAGVNPQNVPLDLNGAGFSLKIGILSTKTEKTEQLASTRDNHRVTSRTWQAGSSRMMF
jgi:hypothetical protein